MRWPLLSLFPMTLMVLGADSQHYEFATSGYIIVMDVRFLDPYVGNRLVFYNSANPREEICALRFGASTACPERFVGAVATIIFEVKRRDGSVPRKISIREYVTIIAQSPDLPPWGPFEKTQPFNGGVLSDIQVFGYEESDVADGERIAARKESRKLWRLFRQDLYMNGDKEPFATIQWRHTLERIEIVRVQGQ